MKNHLRIYSGRYAALFLFVLLVVSCPVWAQPTGRWTNTTPGVGGRLSAIVASLTDPNTLLVASPGGGVWRSTNGGATWEQTPSYGLGDYSVTHLQWDRFTPGRLFATTYTDLYASTDLGNTWTNLTQNGGYPTSASVDIKVSVTTDPMPFAQLMITPTSGITLFATPASGLLYSTDGTHFTQHWPFSGGALNQDNTIISIAADDATGLVYFTTMKRPIIPLSGMTSGGSDSSLRAHIFRSRCPWTIANPCLSWAWANSNLPFGRYAATITSCGNANRMATAIVASGRTDIYTSTDGLYWRPTSALPGSSWDCRVLAAPAPNQLVAGTVIPYISNDFGATWAELPGSRGLHPDVRSIFWATYPAGSKLWVSTDGTISNTVNLAQSDFVPGTMPSPVVEVPVSGIKALQPFYVTAIGRSGTANKRMFMGTIDNGGLCSDNNGAAWTTQGVPRGNGSGDYISLVAAPSNPDRVYARSGTSAFSRTDNALSASTQRDVVWQSIEDARSSTPQVWSNAMISVDPRNPDRVGFTCNQDIALSTDGGMHFVHHPLPENARPVSILLADGGDIYVGTIDKGVYKSTNNGATWQPFALNTNSPSAVMKVAHTTAGGTGGTFFLATTKGLYRKLPGGDFVLASADPAYTVSDVEIDPRCPSRIYASFGFAGNMMQHRGGIIMSTDNGSTFTSITSGLPIHQSPIPDIQVDPTDSRYLHAAVYGQGSWTYDLGATPVCR